MNKIYLACLFTLFLIVVSLKSFTQYTYHCGGYLLHCHGVNGYIDAEDPLYYNQSITLAAWVRCEVKNPSNMGIIYREFFVNQGASTRLEWGIVINANGEFMFRGEIDTSAGRTFEPSTLPQLDSLSSGLVPDSGKFYHVAVTLDQSSFVCNFYINGVVVRSKTMKGGLHWATAAGGNFNDMSIGCHSVYYQNNFNTDSYFNGYIDDVFMSDNVVTKSQLDSIALGKDLASASNVFYHFNEGSGSTTVSHPGVTYNSLGYGNTGYLNGDIAWVTNDACPPFPLSFIDPYPAMVDNNGTLNTNISNIDMSKTVVGAATDGLSKVLLVAKTDKDIQFQISSLAQGSLSSLDQSVTNQTAVQARSNNGYAVAVYTAPDGYGSNNPKGGRNISVYGFRLDSPTIYSVKNLQLITPPVVLVHGMWSDPFVWLAGGFVRALIGAGYSYPFISNFKGLSSIFLADYSEDGASTFDPFSQESIYGRSAVQKAVIDALKSYRNNQIVATQVDVVGHSLGGLMARSFSQQGPSFSNKENYKKGYIHKLITLGTPHMGSPLGPLLYYNYAPINFLYNQITILGPLQILMRFIGNPIGLCHRDFDKNGPVISNNLLKTPPYYTYAIGGDYIGNYRDQVSYVVFDDLVYILSGGKTHANLFHIEGCLNSEPANDIIVPMYSQIGGNKAGQIFTGTSHLELLLHTGETSETNGSGIQDSVVQLLLSNNATKFDKGFIKAGDIHVDCDYPSVANRSQSPFDKNLNTVRRERNDNAQNQVVQIVSPSRGSIVQANSKVNLTLQYQVLNGAIPSIAMFIVKDVGWFTAPVLPPYSISITLPDSVAIGNLNIALLARDTTGLIMADTTSIVVKPSGNLDSISVSPGSIYLDSTLRVASLNVQGYYSGGQPYNEADITNGSARTTYSSQEANSIFKVSQDGIITALSPGTDTLVISNSGKIVKLPITVDSNFKYVTLYKNGIDFPPIPDKLVTDVPFVLVASDSSAADVTFTLVSGPATLQNGVVTIAGKGTVTIEATSPGDAYFREAAPVFRTFQITDALPLALLNFEGFLNSNKQVNLGWQTAQEINTSYFIIERSSDGNAFTSLDKVYASGNNSTTKSYTYLDQNPLKGTNYYRLKMVDADGKFTYTKVIAIKVNQIESLFKIFPNPAKNIVNLYGTNMDQIKIFDIAGKIVLFKKLTTANHASVNVGILSTGTYTIEVQNSRGDSEKRKLIIQ